MLYVSMGQKIMSTAMHGADESEVVNSCESTCMSKNYGILHHDKCSHQDVRELRTKNGKSSLEKKNIVRCTLCGACATSEALALAKLRQWFGEAEPHVSIEGDYIWSSGSAMSRWQLKMEIEMLHAMVPPIDDKRSMDSVFTVSEKILFVCNALRNLHRSDHCKSCFKNGLECRMMVPSCACQQCEVMFNDENSNWYDWQGNNVPRPLFLFRPERSHGDMFVNVHNSMASVLFGCNTNVIAGVDGGSVMYCTCYISKNTQKEDSEHYGRAAKQMVKKMKASVENAEQQQSSSTAEGSVDKISVGMKGMIGGVFMASAALKTSAPLAAYLIRNGSRFHYSHRVGYVNKNSYFSGLDNDISIDSTGEGKVFYKSQVANYLCRPNLLENVSLYDFVSDYSVCRPSATSMDWAEPHPSKNYLKVKKINVKRVPSINYLDFVDTKFFGGNNILTCGVPDDDKEEYQMMEEYARKVCALFLPFRHDANQLKVDGSFIKCLRKAFGDGTLKASHKDVLRNVQDCRNSLNVGRPMDYLERVTEKPNDCERGVGDVINGEADVDFDEMNDAVDELLNIAGTFGDDMNLRDASDRLRFASYMTRCHGTNQCGQNLVLCPKTPPNSVDVCKVDGVSHCRRTTNEINALYSNSVTKEALHELAVRVLTTRVTDESGNVDVNVTGTLQNVRAYAEYHFLGDEDQKVAFESIVCAFILQLYREASKNRDVLQPRKMRKLNNVLKVIEKVNRDSQLIAFLSGAGGTGKSHVIKTVCRYAKKLCESLNVVYNKRTIVVTALTGAAAVSVNGETTHMACALARSVSHKEMDEFEHAYMLIVDEVSFASKEVMEKLDRKMRQIMEQPELRFGGIPLVFAGDFTQLRPVGSLPIYLFPDFEIWFDWVHTFIELKTKHQFENDPAYGRLLGRYRETGPTTADVQKINTRVVGSIGGPKESDIPNDAVYATKTNIDRMAINDAIFAKHLENTHFRNLNVLPPKHTVCIKATALKFKKRGRGNEYISMNKAGKDIMYAAVGEAHVEAPGHKFHDPLLKLYSGQPLMINRNEDVSACIANGAMCEFKGVDLKRGISYNDLEIIIIDGFFVWCACVSQIDALVVNMVDGNSS
ncbi:MAG TPA: AAA family ATPase [Fusibacter sp.]|nr:AAA family ATPase [Fusibacter sp.]